MKIASKNKSKKTLLIIVTAIIILLLSLAAYVYFFNGDILGWNNIDQGDKAPASSNQSNKPTNEQVSAGEDTTPGGSDPSPAPSQQPGKTKDSVEMMFTAANQNEEVLQMRVLIGSVVNTGECNLTMKNGSLSIKKTAAVQPLASTSTCKGFDIPVSELSVGTWQTTVTYENSTLTGAVFKTIEIK